MTITPAQAREALDRLTITGGQIYPNAATINERSILHAFIDQQEALADHSPDVGNMVEPVQDLHKLPDASFNGWTGIALAAQLKANLEKEARELFEAAAVGNTGSVVDVAYRAIAEALRMRDEAREEVKRCHRRLEIDRLWGAEGKPFDVPEDARSKVPDGIECRDDTIALQKQSIDTLRARLEAAEAVIKPFAKHAKAYEPDEGDGDQNAWDAGIVLTIGNLRAAAEWMEGEDE